MHEGPPESRAERGGDAGAERTAAGHPSPAAGGLGTRRSRSTSAGSTRDRVLRAVEAAASEIVAFTADLIRIPTVNPPGDAYPECARLIGDRLRAFDFDVEYHHGDGRPEHTARHPRVNVVGRRAGSADRPLVHLNGHMDVVPAGGGWSVDPFGGLIRGRRIHGRGAADMKAGLAAAVHAAEAIRRAGVPLRGTIEVSGTVDEESGGWAGVALLAERGRLSAARTDYVIIPEPLNVDRICVGHRGAYWFEITTHGRTAHGSMPFLGASAIDHMTAVLEAVRTELAPALAARTTAMPVVPLQARHATINVNAICGGQAGYATQTPCVADRCSAVLDRRVLPEEDHDTVRAEVVALLERVRTRVPGLCYTLTDLMRIHPVQTPERSPLVAALRRGISDVLGRDAALVASPGTYDHKHVARIAGIDHCVAYGPGVLDVAHQPDEWCDIDDLVSATQVVALAILDLTGTSV
jgi:succinyl-diaminopimelate desuccinylase